MLIRLLECDGTCVVADRQIVPFAVHPGTIGWDDKVYVYGLQDGDVAVYIESSQHYVLPPEAPEEPPPGDPPPEE